MTGRRDADLTRAARAAQLDAAVIATTIERTLRTLRANQAGYPTTASGATSNGGNTTDTPTERAALNPDPARQAHHDLTHQLDVAVRALANAARICKTWTRGHQLTPTERDRLAHANAEPGCTILARIGVWEPIYRTTNLGGLLPDERGVSRWVYDFAARTGRLPTHDEMRRHHTGRRITLRA